MRWVKRILVFFLIVVLAGTAYGVLTVRRSFPKVGGDVEVAGLSDTVEVFRDGLGVPHIYATNAHDLFFAQGYTHAQDRFWQMDFWRHIGAARLSEMFGESQIDTDKFLRSLGFARLAEQEWAVMGSPARDVLKSYADGVNAYLDSHSGAQISLEYAILPLQNSGYEIEPWSPVNTLTWAKVMSWDLSGNMRNEIARAVLGTDLSPERVEQLFPDYPADKPVIVEDHRSATTGGETPVVPEGALTALRSAGAAAADLWALTGGGFEGIGSNNWVVGGSHTESGMPLLANDTHLAIQMPSIWYENGLHCVGDAADCPYQLVGFSFAGTPGVVVGHNDHHAWGVTTEAADTQDLFIERVNPEDPGQYEAEGAWVDFEVRTETIEVAGGDDIQYDVRSTRHGPVISGTFLEEGEFDDSATIDVPEEYVVALAWQSLEPSTLVEAVLGIDLAQSYEEFRDAVSLWDIAAQNVVYADIEGNIAYHSTGEIPIRAAGDGRHPVPGWTGEYEWVGLVPYEEMPSMLNPAQGYIETANQPVLRPAGSPLIGIDGAYGYRGSRIEQMILADDSHTIETMQQMQFDARDPGAEVLVPWLLAVDPAGDDLVGDVQARLESWSNGGSAFQASGESQGAAVYMAVWRHLLINTFQDELPEDHWPSGGDRWSEVVRHLMDTPEDLWWDDVSTVEVETRDDILHRTMNDAHKELSAMGNGLRWGDLHVAHFESQTLGQSGIGPIEWLFNRTAPERVGGSESIVNAVGWDTSVGYAVDWVPSQRMVVDLGDLGASTFIHTTGQSGHAFHEHYDSMIEMWVDGLHGSMLWTRDQVEAAAENVLTLVSEG